MGKRLIQSATIVACLIILSTGCTGVPDDHDPGGVYPTFVDLDATSGILAPGPPNLDAEDSGEEDTGAGDTGTSSNCPGICNINPNNPACVNCP